MKQNILLMILILTGLLSAADTCAEYNVFDYDSAFTYIDPGLPGVIQSSSCWGDYDNDGDLDILLTGYAFSERISKIFRNDSCVFTDINAGMEGVNFSSAAWGDYDNDGDLDVLLTGDTGSGNVSKIYRNDGSDTFTDIDAGLTPVQYGSVAWSDYDNDGDLDILLTGDTGSGNVSKIYLNDGSGTFTDIDTELTPVQNGSASWSDYDNDGDPDILITGSASAEVYRNDSGVFTNINAGLLPFSISSSCWGDYDNDGDPDILITGIDDNNADFRCTIYRNDSGQFTEINTELPAVVEGSVTWGDYDNDGDLDILIAGNAVYYGGEFLSIFRNNSLIKNTKSEPPSNLNVNAVTGLDDIIFSWDKGSDSETPQSGLSYNIDVSMNGYSITSSMSDTENGYRKIAAYGNACEDLSYINSKIRILPQTINNIFWKVQSIDHTFCGSEFAVQDTSIIADYLLISSKTEMYSDDLISWEVLYPELTDHYEIQIDADEGFGSPWTGSVIVETKTKSTEIALSELNFTDSLQSNVRYYWRLRPVYTDPLQNSVYSNIPLSFIFDPQYYPPSSVSIEVSGNFAIISWGSKEDAKGETYNIYSSDDPYADFPSGWSLEAAVSNTTQWITQISALKKFYCVTSSPAKGCR